MKCNAGSGSTGISIASLRFPFAKLSDSICPFSLLVLFPTALFSSRHWMFFAFSPIARDGHAITLFSAFFFLILFTWDCPYPFIPKRRTLNLSACKKLRTKTRHSNGHKQHPTGPDTRTGLHQHPCPSDHNHPRPWSPPSPSRK